MTTPLSPKLRKRLARCKEGLRGIDLVLQGSLTERWMPCGRAGCRCQAEPPELHGPYYQWTAKVDGKTKTLRLQKEDLETFRAWIAEGRRLEEYIREWRALSLEAIEECLRSERS
jgi:hypothetical protein